MIPRSYKGQTIGSDGQEATTDDGGEGKTTIEDASLFVEMSINQCKYLKCDHWSQGGALAGNFHSSLIVIANICEIL